MKENQTNVDSEMMLKIITFIEEENKIQAIESKKAILNMGVRDSLRKKETPHIAIQVKEKNKTKNNINEITK